LLGQEGPVDRDDQDFSRIWDAEASKFIRLGCVDAEHRYSENG